MRLALLLLLALPALGQDGDFKVTSGSATTKVQKWGPDCGPKPRSEALPAGDVYLFTGGVLKPKARARPIFGKGVCQVSSGLPGLSESISGARIRCASKAGAAKQVAGSIKLGTPDPNSATVSHTFDYKWQLKGSTCVVGIRSRWKLSRSEPIVVPEKPVAEVDACATPGPAASIAAQGSKGRAVRAGKRLRLQVKVLDAAGCATRGPVSWSASEGSVRRGVLSTKGVAPGASVEVKASLGSQTITYSVRVLGDADFATMAAAQPDLVEGQLDPLPPQAGAGAGATGSSERGGDGYGGLLLGIFLGVGAFAGLIGLWIAWRATQRREKVVDDDLRARFAKAQDRQPSRSKGEALGAEATAPLASRGSGVARRCTECGRGFDAETSFCPFDGSPLEPT